MYQGFLLTVDPPGRALPFSYVLRKVAWYMAKGSFDSRSQTRSRSGRQKTGKRQV